MRGDVEVDEFFVKSGLKGRGYSELIKQRRMPKKRGLRLRGRGIFEKDLIGCFLIKERGRKIRRILLLTEQIKKQPELLLMRILKMVLLFILMSLIFIIF